MNCNLCGYIKWILFKLSIGSPEMKRIVNQNSYNKIQHSIFMYKRTYNPSESLVPSRWEIMKLYVKELPGTKS